MSLKRQPCNEGRRQGLFAVLSQQKCALSILNSFLLHIQRKGFKLNHIVKSRVRGLVFIKMSQRYKVGLVLKKKQQQILNISIAYKSGHEVTASTVSHGLRVHVRSP